MVELWQSVMYTKGVAITGYPDALLLYVASGGVCLVCSVFRVLSARVVCFVSRVACCVSHIECYALCVACCVLCVACCVLGLVWCVMCLVAEFRKKRASVLSLVD